MINDEPLDEPQPVNEPLEYGCKQELTPLTQNHKSHNKVKSVKTQRGYGKKKEKGNLGK